MLLQQCFKLHLGFAHRLSSHRPLPHPQSIGMCEQPQPGQSSPRPFIQIPRGEEFSSCPSDIGHLPPHPHGERNSEWAASREGSRWRQLGPRGGRSLQPGPGPGPQGATLEFRLLSLFCSCGFELDSYLPGGSVVKNPPANAGDADMGLIPQSGRSPGEGNGNPLQYSCREKSMGRGAWGDHGPWGPKESDTTEHAGTLPPAMGRELTDNYRNKWKIKKKNIPEPWTMWGLGVQSKSQV